jgi:PAS domain S-box-containing protein
MHPFGSAPAPSERPTVACQPYLVSLVVLQVALAVTVLYWRHSVENATQREEMRLEHRFIHGAHVVEENVARITALHDAMGALLRDGPLPAGAWSRYASAVRASKIHGLESFGVIDGQGRAVYWLQGTDPVIDLAEADGGVRLGHLIRATRAGLQWRVVTRTSIAALTDSVRVATRPGEPPIRWTLGCGGPAAMASTGRRFELGIAGATCYLTAAVPGSIRPSGHRGIPAVGIAASVLLAGFVLALGRARSAALRQTEAIREQKRQTEAAARRLISIANRSDNGFLILNAQGRIVWVNDVIVRRSGYARDELTGLDPFFLLNGPGARLVELDYARRSLEAGKPVRFEAPAFSRSGERYWIEVDMHPILAEAGDAEYVLGITRLLSDNAEARDSALRMRHALESVNEGIAVWDRAGCYVYHNPAFAKNFGYTIEACRDAGGPDGLLVETDGQSRVWDLDGARELTIRCRDGSVRQTRVTSSTIRNEMDQPIGRIAVFTDISEAKLVERQLRLARDAALEASAAKSAFLANMSHELRTPLNGVIGMVNLLLSTELDAEQREYAGLAHLSGEALVRVINDILDFSKIEAGRLRLDSVPFDLVLLLEECAAQVLPAALERGLALEVHVDPSLRPMRRGDPARVRQIVGNLLSNAVKFSDRGGIRIHAGSLGKGVRLEVRDTGVGIPPQALHSVFEPFTQADVTNTRRFGGAGLGLAICRQLAGMMDGAISVSSQYGFGSTFIVELPVPAAAEMESLRLVS